MAAERDRHDLAQQGAIFRRRRAGSFVERERILEMILVGAAVSREDDDDGRLLDLGLIHAGVAERGPHGRAGDDDEAHGLEIVAAGRPLGDGEQAVHEGFIHGLGREMPGRAARAGEGLVVVEGKCSRRAC